uniref:uncharacterized protein LOC104266097 n=1 Tax=Ciona intestinalis TaxID=7719 RepID=UPI000EF4407B|nr:uncharacterized protein LOC104266097 [Ciona intestinalis]|eukprot:XP_009859885.3 uncharacterized protein LOC104266097 [Ciona intestinalis]
MYRKLYPRMEVKRHSLKHGVICFIIHHVPAYKLPRIKLRVFCSLSDLCYCLYLCKHSRSVYTLSPHMVFHTRVFTRVMYTLIFFRLLNENIKTVLRGTVALNFAVLIGLCILDPEPSRGPYTAIRYLPPRGILLSTATVWISYSFFCEARTIVRYSAGKEIGVKIKKIVFLQALLVTGCGSLSLQAAVTQSYSVAYVMCLVSYTCFIPIGWFCVSLLRHNIREKEVCDARGAEIAIIKMELASLVNGILLSV